jgi:hypothetical protein
MIAGLLAGAALLLLMPVAARAKNYETTLRAIQPEVPGLQVATEGGDSYLVVTNKTGKTVIVTGYDGEPYLRFRASGDVEANAHSPAKYLNEIRFGTPESVTIPRSALTGTKPKWEQVSNDGSYKWFDHRIHWMEKQPPPVVKDEGKRTKIFDWKVPVEVGGTSATLTGTLTWVPTAASSSGVSAGAIVAIVAGALVLLALLAYLVRRRRGRASGEPSAEKAKEAW